jgi:hypothetical protein
VHIDIQMDSRQSEFKIKTKRSFTSFSILLYVHYIIGIVKNHMYIHFHQEGSDIDRYIWASYHELNKGKLDIIS